VAIDFKTKDVNMKNFDVDKENDSVLIAVNPKIYPLEVIYSAAYTFLDRAFVIIDGDPNEEVLVQLKAKEASQNLEELAQSFNNELVSYAVYVVQAARTSGIRQAIVQAALGVVEKEEEKEEDLDYIKDPLGIAKPWVPESAEGLEIPKEIETKEESNEK